MNYRYFLPILLAVAVVMAFAVAPASAEVKTGGFGAEATSFYNDQGDPAQTFTGEGDGWNGDGQGPWYQYEWADSPDPPPGYNIPNTPAGSDPTKLPSYILGPANQWWYNDPFDDTRRKWYSIKLWASRLDPMQTGYVAIIVNWTNDLWPVPGTGPDGPPPLPGAADDTISRKLLHQATVDQNGRWLEFEGFIPVDYNPEWISTDLMGENFFIPYNNAPYDFDNPNNTLGGYIWHECQAIPEPATIVILLGLGLMVGLRFCCVRPRRKS